MFFLPGLLNDASLFREQIAALAPVALISVADLTRSESIAELADDALKLAPEGKFILVGLSMGGYVALEIMRRAPQRISGLALIDTSAQPDTPQATAAREELMALAETDLNEVVERLLPKLSHPKHMDLPEVRGAIQSMAASLGKEVFQRQQRAITGRPDSRPSLSAIACPTLVICGREDLITPPEIAKELVAGITHATLEIIEECGHLSTLDQPEKVSQLLVHWIEHIEC